MYFHVRGVLQLHIIYVAITVLPKSKLGFLHIQKTWLQTPLSANHQQAAFAESSQKKP